jgi:hypothetical protein
MFQKKLAAATPLAVIKVEGEKGSDADEVVCLAEKTGRSIRKEKEKEDEVRGCTGVVCMMLMM